MSIKRLSPSVTSKLRSGITINNVAQCVEELVLNSLDSGATSVDVRLDLSNFFKVQVVDNGSGISRDALVRVGERYATSKCSSFEDMNSTRTFGHRGEALASIAEISQELTVSSRTREQQVTYVKHIVVDGLTDSNDCVQMSNIQRPDSGTTVTVLNFLCNIPVRQLAIHSVLDVEKVRRDLEVLALCFTNVSFSLYDDASKSWCLRVQKTLSTVTTFGHLFGAAWFPLLKSVTAKCPKPFRVRGYIAVKGYHNRNLQFVFLKGRRIIDDKLLKIINEVFDHFGTSGQGNLLTGLSGFSDLFPVFILHLECPRNHYTIGVHSSKVILELQCFEVINFIKDAIKRFFDKYFHTGSAHDENEPSITRSNKVDSNFENVLNINVQDFGKSLQSNYAKRPYKSINGRTVKNEDRTSFTKDITVKPSSSSSKFTLCLSRNPGFDLKTVPIGLNRVTANKPTAFGRLLKKIYNEEERELRTLSTINELQQRYSCIEENPPRKKNKQVTLITRATPVSDSLNPTEIKDKDTNLIQISDCFAHEGLSPRDNSIKEIAVDQEENHKNWIQGSGLHGEDDRLYYLDAFSGNSYFGKPEEHKPKQLLNNCATLMSSRTLPLDIFLANEETKLVTDSLPWRPWSSSKGTELEILNNPPSNRLAIPTQLENSVSKLYEIWENPILGSATPSEVMVIKQLSSMSSKQSSQSFCHSYLFSSHILQNIQVIGQMDRKFIICAAPYQEIPEMGTGCGDFSLKPNLIVLFDQHAVHERIRLENSLKEACFNTNDIIGELYQTPKASNVDPPLTVCLPPDIVRLTIQHRAQLFQLYAIGVSPNDRKCIGEEGTGSVIVHSLPSCLLEKEKSEKKQSRPSILHKLTQAVILEVIEELLLNRAFLPTIPKVILNLLKSQSCHGAVKFGDQLNVSTCQEFMFQLSKCQLPFQCAHGRPSVTALCDLKFVQTSKQIPPKPNLLKLKYLMANAPIEMK